MPSDPQSQTGLTRPLARSLGSRTNDPGSVVGLDAQLDRARKEYALRRLGPTSQILTRLEETLTKAAAVEAEVELRDLLLASVLALRGRLCLRLGDETHAIAAFADAAAIFARQQEAIPQQRQRNWLYTDFGIALYRLSQFQAAADALDRALESGVSPAETFCYRGLAYAELGRPDIAEESIRNGLDLLPGDPILLLALADILSGNSGTPQAASVRLYCDAAAAAIAGNDAAAADIALYKALAIAPADATALDLAVEYKRSKGRLAEALDVVDRALAREPGSTLAGGWKAILLRDLGNDEEALKLFDDLNVVAAELAWLLVEHGRTLLRDGAKHRARALDLARRALELNPRDAEALVLESEIIADEDAGRALSRLRSAIDQTPDLPALWVALAQLQLRQKDYDAALASVARVFELEPDSVAGLIVKADLFTAQGSQSEATSLLRRAVSARPDDAAILCKLVDTLRDAGLVEEAILELDRQIAANRSYWQAYWKRGLVLLGADRMTEAVDALRAATAICPEVVDLQIDLAEVLLYCDDFPGARDALDKALGLAPTLAKALIRRIQWLCLTGNYDCALPLARQVAAKEPDDSRRQLLLGQVLRFAGTTSPSETEAAFRRACELDPGNAGARVNLAAFLVESFRLDEARKLAGDFIAQEQAAGSDAAAPELLGLLGWAQYLVGNYDEALRLIQVLISYYPNDAGSQFDRALVLLAAGRTAGVASYEQTMSTVRRLHPLHQQGVLYVALWDLISAAFQDSREQINRSDATTVFTQLHSALLPLGLDQTQMPWHGSSLAECAARRFDRVVAPQAEQLISAGSAAAALALLESCSALAGGRRWLLIARAHQADTAAGERGNAAAAENALRAGLASQTSETDPSLRVELLAELAWVLGRWREREEEALQFAEEARSLARATGEFERLLGRHASEAATEPDEEPTSEGLRSRVTDSLQRFAVRFGTRQRAVTSAEAAGFDASDDEYP